VATRLPYHKPTIFFKQPYQFTGLHFTKVINLLLHLKQSGCISNPIAIGCCSGLKVANLSVGVFKSEIDLKVGNLAVF